MRASVLERSWAASLWICARGARRSAARLSGCRRRRSRCGGHSLRADRRAAPARRRLCHRLDPALRDRVRPNGSPRRSTARAGAPPAPLPHGQGRMGRRARVALVRLHVQSRCSRWQHRTLYLRELQGKAGSESATAVPQGLRTCVRLSASRAATIRGWPPGIRERRLLMRQSTRLTCLSPVGFGRGRAHGIAERLRWTGAGEASADPADENRNDSGSTSSGTRRALGGEAVAALLQCRSPAACCGGVFASQTIKGTGIRGTDGTWKRAEQEAL